MHVPPGSEMFHTKMVTIPENEYEHLKAIQHSYEELKLQYYTLLHERDHDAS